MTLSAFLLLVVFAPVVFRVTELVHVDDGPANIFLRARMWAGLYDLDAEGNQTFDNVSMFQKFVGQILDCPYCLGVYVSAGATLVWGAIVYLFSLAGQEISLARILVLAPIVWLALAGAQSYLQTTGGRFRE